MKNKLLQNDFYSRYKDLINENNIRGMIAGGMFFAAATLGDYFLRIGIGTTYADLGFVFFDLCVAIILLLVKTFYKRMSNIMPAIEIVWYALGFSYACHVQFIHTDNRGLVVFGITALALAVEIIFEPLVLVLLQALGALGFILTAVLLSDVSINIDFILGTLVLSLISTLAGNVVTYLRVNNLVFMSDMIFLSESEDEDLINENFDKAWSGKNKYGILSGKLVAKRRVFSFTFNVTKGSILHVRKANIFNLEDEMKWEEVRERILSKTLDPLSRKRLSKLLDLESITHNFKAGKRRDSCIAGFTLEDSEKLWVDMEIAVRVHPITGEIIASAVIEDVTQERILMGVLNRIVDQNYDYVMCIERERNLTITFRVDPGEEINGFYGEKYEVETARYINETVDKSDSQRVTELMSLEYVDAVLSKSGTHEFLVNEVDSEGNLYKMLFQYSYLDPAHNFLCVIKQNVTAVIKKEDETKELLSKALTEREAAMNAKSDFMTRMSHEMRTPMNAILGLTELMKDEINHPEAMKDYIEKVQYSGAFLLQLINDVLDMTKMEQNKFELNYVSYSFGSFWEAIDTMIRPMCIRKGVDFEWKSSIPENYYFMIDPLRITQVFINLLSNSVKFTNEGGHITFECREEARVENRAKLVFRVIDDGIGMSEAFLKRIFEPFAQESKDVNSNLAGTGLGLSIVKGIVEALDGTIDFESEEGVGTTAVVTFDIEICKEGPKIRERDKNANFEGKRILVVEDNDINREIAVELLKKKGMIVETAVNGEEAVLSFDKKEPGYFDLILMDIRMPVMDGLTASRHIRKLPREDAKQIPIVAMTANAFTEDIQASLDAGLNEHLSKPIDPKILYETLGKYLSND